MAAVGVRIPEGEVEGAQAVGLKEREGQEVVVEVSIRKRSQPQQERCMEEQNRQGNGQGICQMGPPMNEGVQAPAAGV